MFVIVDTTEFFNAPLADTAPFKVLEEYLQKTQSQLIVPEVVFQEAVNHARKKLKQLDRELEGCAKDYGRFKSEGAGDLAINKPDFDQALRAYEANFRHRLLHVFHAIFLPMPTVTHTQMLERALQGTRPFHENKDGYRDTLIWLSILNRVREHPAAYVFITNNTRDFTEEVLKAELGDLPEHCSFSFALNLKTFIDQYAKAELERLNALANRLRVNRALPGFSLQDELGNPGHQLLGSIAGTLKIRDYRYRDVEGPYYISSYEPAEDIEVQEVYRAQDEIIVECSASYYLTIDGYLFKSEAYGLDKDDRIYVTDWEWNEHYTAVEFSANVIVHFMVQIVEDEEPENVEDDGPENENDDQAYFVQSIDVVEATIEDD
jgi:hypothetical protein